MYDSRELIASLIYLVVGGEQGMMVFPKDSEIAIVG